MIRTRLRPAYAAGELASIYQTPHDHTRWEDHKIRVGVTIESAEWFVRRGDVRTVADLSCGDAAIARALDVDTLILGDYAPGYEHTGPIETTIRQIPDAGVDLFICSETLEHLDDPDSVLAAIRTKTRYLVLSTPEGETTTTNPEHYWGWDSEAVEKMLRDAGFTPEVHTILGLREYHYDFQIWACR